MSQKAYEANLAREWDRTAYLCALLANINSSKGKRFQPSDFHPLLDVSSSSKPMTAEEREELFAKLKKL